MKDKYYTIIAGVNGAGKTSLYSIIKSDETLGKRINIDEIVSEQGEWQDTLLQIRSGRLAMSMISDCIASGQSFHQETTLPGVTTEKHILSAKSKGFKIIMYFIGLNDINIAISRVHKRVERGGHGIEDRVIIKRYEQQSENLLKIIPLCDKVIFYDNSTKFRQIAVWEQNQLIDCDFEAPEWFINICKSLDIPLTHLNNT